MWLVYCLSSTVASGFISVFLRKCKNSDGTASILISVIANNFVFFIIGVSRGYLQTFDPSLLLKFFPIYALHLTGVVANVLCAKYARVSLTTPVKRVRSIVPLILSFFIFNERLTAAQLIVSFSLFGLSVLSCFVDRQDSGGKLSREEYFGIFLAFIYASFNGTSSFLTKIYVAEYHDPFIVSFYCAVLTIPTMLLYAVFTGQLNKLSFKYIDGKWWFIGYILSDVLVSILNRLSFVDGPISIMYVLQGSSIVVTTILSRVILKEKISFKKYLVITGIFILGVVLSFIS